MSEESLDDYQHNKLKQISIELLEETIKKSIFVLVGIDFECSISKIEYSRNEYQGATFEVALKKDYIALVRDRVKARHSLTPEEQTFLEVTKQ